MGTPARTLRGIAALVLVTVFLEGLVVGVLTVLARQLIYVPDPATVPWAGDVIEGRAPSRCARRTAWNWCVVRAPELGRQRWQPVGSAVRPFRQESSSRAPSVAASPICSMGCFVLPV